MNTYITAGGVTREVFVDGDQAPAFTLSLSDLLDPSSIRGTRSSTIRILNTPESRAVLGSEAMMSIGPDRPTIKFLDGGIDVFTSEIVVLRSDRNVFECAAVGGNAMWFEWAKKTKLSALDLGISERIIASVIADTWTNAPGAMYFPLIDFGSLEDRAITYEVPADVIRPGVGLKYALAHGFNSQDWHFSAKGLFADHLKKMVVHNGGRNAKSIDDGNGANTIAAHMTVNPDTPYSFKRYGGANPDPVDLSDLTITLGSSMMSGTSESYLADRDLTMHTSFVTLRIGIPTGYVGYRFRVVLWDRTDGRELAGVWSREMTGGDSSPFEFTGTLPKAYVLNGHDVHFAVLLDDAFGSASYTGSLSNGPPNQINYDPEVPYLYDSKLIIGTAAPDLTIIDVLKGINDWRGLVFNTLPLQRRIEVWYDDEFFRPLTATDKRDMRGRIDHTVAPAKLNQQLPVRFLYRFKEDKNDREVSRITRLIGAPGYANADVEIGGYMDERTVTLPFAATAMGSILDDELMVPVIRRVDGDYQVDYFDIEPRILIADGQASANWTLQADPVLGTAPTDLSYYPKCYFLWPGGRNIPMAFGEAIHLAKGFGPNLTLGTTKTSALRRIQRMANSKVFEGYAAWDDFELTELDFGQATVVHDGHSEGTYYVQKVGDRRLGQDRFSKTLFIEAPQAAAPVMPRITYCDGALRVSDSGSPEVDGIYCPDGMENDAPVWTKEGGVRLEDSMYYPLYEGDPLGYFVMTSGGTFEDDPANALYSTFDLPSNPAAVWDVFTAFGGGGDTPVPTVTAL